MDIKKELEEIFNDNLLKCEIVTSKEDELSRVDLIKWADGTFSVATVAKCDKKLYVSYRNTLEDAMELYSM